MIYIREIKIELNTTNGLYGYHTSLTKGLNIIRGDNTSGKSTLINSIIYGFGMEELLGSRNEKVLPYALKTFLDDDDSQITINSSFIYIEIENSSNEIVTLKRPIKSTSKSSKLIEIIQGPILSTPGNYEIIPTYIHDAGSAKSVEAGFFRYIEDFIDFKLPFVPNSQSGETKLYIQTIFAALFIEQKKGWTDYIANIPYFRIKNTFQRIFEYLLDLDVFENERLRNEYKIKIDTSINEWKNIKDQIKSLELSHNFNVIGVPRLPADDFNESNVNIYRIEQDSKILIQDYIDSLIKEYQKIENQIEHNDKAGLSEQYLELYNNTTDEMNSLMTVLRTKNSEIQEYRQSITDYIKSLEEVKNDIEKNKIAKKLKDIGYEIGLTTSHDKCPTCNQHIDDTLLLNESSNIMTVDDNIIFLKSQRNMIMRYIKGLEDRQNAVSSEITEISNKISEKRKVINSIETDLKHSSKNNESTMRIKIQHENEIEALQASIESINSLLEKLTIILSQWMDDNRKLKKIPTHYLSDMDNTKIKEFQNNFRKLADCFGFKSTNISDIIIDEDTYKPFMTGEIIRYEIKTGDSIKSEGETDIKNDSSASDFVRLIWAYLISLFYTSKEYNGNHPNTLIFDEPSQHSMGLDSFNALLIEFSKNTELQTIVAASFDESEEVFEKSTRNVEYNYIHIENKLLKKITN